MDIANYSSDSRAVIKNAKEVAAQLRHIEIDVEHLLIATIRHEGSEVESILNQLGKSVGFIESAADEYLKDQTKKSTVTNPTISPGVQEALIQAVEEKSKLMDALVEPEHIFIAIFDPKSKLSGYVREKIELTKEDIYNAIADSKSVAEITTSSTTADGQPVVEGEKKVSGTLRYCVDLTNQAAAGEFDPVIGRSKEVQQAIQILLRRRKNSPVLVGGAGVGKTAIVEGFCQAIIDGAVPKALHDVKVMEVDMGALVAGAKYKGEFEERFKTLVSEVVKSGGKIVLFIDEIHNITTSGGSGGTDAANLIKPALARGQLRLIGATTDEEYTKCLEKDKALDRRFEKVRVEQPNYDDSVRILQGVATKYEEHHKIVYDPEALCSSVKFAQRYLSERNLPDIALDIIDEAASEFDVKKEMAGMKIPIMKEQITEINELLKKCDGKTPEKCGEDYEKLTKVYDTFSRNLETLDDHWGYRLEAKSGGTE